MMINRDVSISLLINKLRHGYWLLSRMNWNSYSGVHLSVAGLFGVAGVVLALSKEGKIGNLSSLQWLSNRNGGSEQLLLVPGLQNLGNNCFLNVVLQALASCTCFQSYLQEIMEKYETMSTEEQLETIPVTVSLAALLEDLCMVQDGRTVLSPRKIMHAMNSYIPNFSLTSQQDAAEAFLHLISSLREEFSESYVPSQISLADVSSFPGCRIFTSKMTEDESEQKKWRNLYLGPFDGTVGSILTCQSCSSEIMMDYEFFHSLPLLPVLGRGGTIMAGCAVEDCLKQFIAAEQIDNYQCSRCWHNASVKYLLSLGGNEVEISSLRSCGGQDSCGCKNLSQLKQLPWSNSFSRTFKQLSIARCPKILCIHLQRASMNEYGELIKLRGHVQFPLVLNLKPFMKSGMGTKNWEEHVQRSQEKRTYPNRFNMQINTRLLNHIYGDNAEDEHSEQPGVQDGETTFGLLDDKIMQATQGETNLPLQHMQSDDKVDLSYSLVPLDYKYRLVSVVEHFGKAGSGHYTVYRRMRAMLEDEDHDGTFIDRWFSISDSDVSAVSENDVLGAEASLLFFERIS